MIHKDHDKWDLRQERYFPSLLTFDQMFLINEIVEDVTRRKLLRRKNSLLEKILINELIKINTSTNTYN